MNHTVVLFLGPVFPYKVGQHFTSFCLSSTNRTCSKSFAVISKKIKKLVYAKLFMMLHCKLIISPQYLVEVRFVWCQYIFFLMIINWVPKKFHLVVDHACIYVK
jgi:hypothetical protein